MAATKTFLRDESFTEFRNLAAPSPLSTETPSSAPAMTRKAYQEQELCYVCLQHYSTTTTTFVGCACCGAYVHHDCLPSLPIGTYQHAVARATASEPSARAPADAVDNQDDDDFICAACAGCTKRCDAKYSEVRRCNMCPSRSRFAIFAEMVSPTEGIHACCKAFKNMNERDHLAISTHATCIFCIDRMKSTDAWLSCGHDDPRYFHPLCAAPQLTSLPTTLFNRVKKAIETLGNSHKTATIKSSYPDNVVLRPVATTTTSASPAATAAASHTTAAITAVSHTVAASQAAIATNVPVAGVTAIAVAAAAAAVAAAVPVSHAESGGSETAANSDLKHVNTNQQRLRERVVKRNHEHVDQSSSADEVIMRATRRRPNEEVVASAAAGCVDRLVAGGSTKSPHIATSRIREYTQQMRETLDMLIESHTHAIQEQCDALDHEVSVPETREDESRVQHIRTELIAAQELLREAEQRASTLDNVVASMKKQLHHAEALHASACAQAQRNERALAVTRQQAQRMQEGIFTAVCKAATHAESTSREQLVADVAPIQQTTYTLLTLGQRNGTEGAALVEPLLTSLFSTVAFSRCQQSSEEMGALQVEVARLRYELALAQRPTAEDNIAAMEDMGSKHNVTIEEIDDNHERHSISTEHAAAIRELCEQDPAANRMATLQHHTVNEPDDNTGPKTR